MTIAHMGGIRMPIHRSPLRAFLLLCLSGLGVLSACTGSTSVNSNQESIIVVHHVLSLNLTPEQTGKQTVSCESGEVLTSGGYYNKTALTTNQRIILDSYPSDTTGTPPSTQGQVTDSWTVRAANPTSANISLLVTVNCVKGELNKGFAVKSAVWYDNFAPNDGSQSINEKLYQCPDTKYRSLVGGGFQIQKSADDTFDGVFLAAPIDNPSVLDKSWDVITFFVGGTVYVVCAQGVTPDATVTSVGSATGTPLVETQAEAAASCPANEVLVGGGYLDSIILPTQVDIPENGTLAVDLDKWYAGYHALGEGATQKSIAAQGICVTINPTGKIHITISIPKWLLRIPADQTIAATLNGSGQIKARPRSAAITNASSAPQSAQPVGGKGVTFSITVSTLPGAGSQSSPAGRVITSTSGVTCTLQTTVNLSADPATGLGSTATQPCTTSPGAISAQAWNDTHYPGLSYTGSSPAGGSAAGYQVPSGCGDPAPAIAAATDALNKALPSQITTDDMAFGESTVMIDHGSLTCSPAAGTQRNTPFTYVQSISGSISRNTFSRQDVYAYRQTQLDQLAHEKGSQVRLASAAICLAGLSVVSATATSATIACPAEGYAGWNWTDDALRALARSLVGKSLDQAKDTLSATPGVAPTGTIIEGGSSSVLPNDPDQIVIIAVLKK